MGMGGKVGGKRGEEMHEKGLWGAGGKTGGQEGAVRKPSGGKQ